MPESEAWTVVEGAGKRGLDCGGRCRKARLGLYTWGGGGGDVTLL